MHHKVVFTAFATIMVATVAVSGFRLRAAGVNCGILVTPCDNSWSSRANQTFAFEAAGPYVQLKAYWDTYDACLGEDASSFYYTVCQQPTSRWMYGPSSIQTYVYYNNTQNQCLSRSKNPINSMYGPFTYTVELADCCLDQNAHSRTNITCTRDQVERQMWLEKPTTTDPYNRINNMAAVKGASKSGLMCLTRISTSC